MAHFRLNLHFSQQISSAACCDTGEILNAWAALTLSWLLPDYSVQHSGHMYGHPSAQVNSVVTDPGFYLFSPLGSIQNSKTPKDPGSVGSEGSKLPEDR